MLIAAGVVSGVLGDAVDAIAILAIVALNAVIGFYQEFSAETSIAALMTTTAPQAKVHRDGPVWKAIRASIAVPGVFEPVVDGNELLVDGGVLNNLPGDVMRSLAGGWVVAVDVSLDVDLEMHVATLPSPWRVLRGWINPFTKRSKMVNIVDLMTRTTLLASVQKTEVVKKQVDLYIQPPVRSFGLLQFDSFDAIAEAGYVHGKATLEEWLAEHPQLARILREGG